MPNRYPKRGIALAIGSSFFLVSYMLGPAGFSLVPKELASAFKLLPLIVLGMYLVLQITTQSDNGYAVETVRHDVVFWGGMIFLWLLLFVILAVRPSIWPDKDIAQLMSLAAIIGCVVVNYAWWYMVDEHFLGNSR